KISGDFKGSFESFQSNANIESSMGHANAVITMREEGQAKLQSYTARIDLDEFDIGQLIRQEGNVGKVSLSASVTGEGLSLEEMKATIEATVKRAEVNGYQYTNLSLKG